tara:strand:- start:66 stop:1277 length:1212 start_codon:yes stop_codon:yes gene_type:complete
MILKDLKIIMVVLKNKKMVKLKNISNLFNKFKSNKKSRSIRNIYLIIFEIYIKNIFIRNKKNTNINFIVEKANWAIKWDGIYISNALNKFLKDYHTSITSIPLINSNSKVIHFASQYMWLDWKNILPQRHKYIVSFFHGKPEDSKEVENHIKEFVSTKDSIFKVITASSLVYKRLIKWGIPSKKLVLIHTGVDTNLFSIPSMAKRNKVRKKLGFKNNEIVIGSFQKDGIGWGDGLIPKKIKGPDIFVNSVELISKKLNLVVLLTGPSRGYVKKELTKKNIKFKHFYIDNYEEIVDYYYALDLYIVSSREEGGPKPMIESMASGVPVITTNVGMAKDFIKDKENGGLVESFKPEDIANKSLEILNLPKENLISKAREDVLKADWDLVAKLHWEKAYKPALDSFK